MSTKILIPMMLVAALPGLVRAEGGGAGTVGNGGGGFICPDPEQSELLDLFEAAIPTLVTTEGLKIPSSGASVIEQINAAVTRLEGLPTTYRKLTRALQEVMSAPRGAVPAGAIAFPGDALSPVTKPGCAPTGLILFNDSQGTLLWDQGNVERMPRTQQAALWVHEAVYKFLRESYGSMDSILARKIVSHLFSDEETGSVREAVAKLLLERRPSLTISSATQFIDSRSGRSVAVWTSGKAVIHLGADETIDFESTLAANRAYLPSNGSKSDYDQLSQYVPVDAGPGRSLLACSQLVQATAARQLTYLQGTTYCPQDLGIGFRTDAGAPVRHAREFSIKLAHRPDFGETLVEMKWVVERKVHYLLITLSSEYRVLQANWLESGYAVDAHPWVKRKLGKRVEIVAGAERVSALARAFLTSLRPSEIQSLYKNPDDLTWIY